MLSRLVFAFAVIGALASPTVFAQASFDITNGQTVTAAQTLGANQTGVVEMGGVLNVSSSKNAIAVQGTSTITNSGTIEQTGTARGIRDTGTDVGLTLTVTNNVGATLSATADDAIEIQYPDDGVLFNNYGSVIASGSSDQAINFNHIATASNTLNNYATGHIQATAADAVRPGINGFVYNDGTISVVTPSGDTSSSDGVDAQTNSGITISNAVINGDPANSIGTIEGERHGITGGNTSNTGTPIGLYTMTITNAAGFTIKGDNGSGINIDGVAVNANTGAYDVNGNDPDVTTNEAVLIDNSGSIVGNGATRDGDGVDVDGLVFLRNHGTIRSQCAAGDTSEGVTIGGGTITNFSGAIIEGDNTAGKYNCNPVLNAVTGTGRGITLAGVDHDVNNGDAPIVPTQGVYGFTTVDNFGTVFGDSDSGIALTGAATQYLVSIINEPGATIEGAGQTQPAISTGANQVAIFNSGTIKADNSGVAISLGSGDGTHTNTVQIFGGAARVDGDMQGSTASPSSLVITPDDSFAYTANTIYVYNEPTGTSTIRTNGSGNTFTYANALSNFSSVEIGAGTTVLTASSVNTYTGNTTIDVGGMLKLDGSIASANTFVSGALLGTGTTSGAVEVQNGGTIYPGDTAGDVATLHAGNVTFDAGSNATFDIGNVAASADSISGNDITISNSGLSINLPNNVASGNYVLISGSAITGTFGAPKFSSPVPADMTATIIYTATAVTLSIQTNSAIELQSSVDPSALGQSVTFTATVTGNPSTGTVAFFDGTQSLGSAPINNGVAMLSTANLSAGLHDITATYDNNNSESTSPVLKQEVSPATSSVSLNVSPNPSSLGQNVTLTATVTGQSPTGTVKFDDGSNTICAAAPLNNGVATCATSSLSVGSHALTAMYSGDANNLASSSFGVSQTVQHATTSTTESTSCMTTFVENQPFTLSATVTGVSPTGTVTFSDGANSYCAGTTLTSGSANCTITNLAITGNETQQLFNLTANYSGDTNNAASTSPALAVKVLSSGDVVFRNDFESESSSCPIE